MADERIAFDIEVLGAGSAVSAFTRTEKSLVGLDTAAKKSSKAFADFGDAGDKVGRVLGSISPEMASFTGVIDDAGKAVLALTGFIGGPAGLAVGGVIAALALWKTYTDEQTAAQSRLADETRKAAQQVKTLDDYMRDIAEGRSAKSRTERLDRGGAAPDEIEAEIRRLQALKLGDKEFGVKSSRIERLRAMKAEAEAADAQAILDEMDDEARQMGISPARVARRMPTRSSARSAQGQSLDSLMLGGDRFADINSVTSAAQSDFDKASKARRELEIAAARDLAEQKLEIERQRLADIAAMEERHAQEQAQRNQIIMGGIQAVGGAGISAFQAMAKGQKVSTRQIIGAIGDQMVAEGSRWLFTGAAKLLMGDPSGGGLIGVGTAEIAAGIAMGAAGASGGGGARSAASSGGSARPGEPTSSRRAGDSQQGGTVTVYVDAMVADADAGRRIEQALHEKRRVYGA